MIIDFHTHTFPASIAPKAIQSLSATAHITACTDGTDIGLQKSMENAAIQYSVLLPVATKPSQVNGINELAIKINEASAHTGFISFGGIHPECADYKDILKMLAENGVKGIKIHPVFQKTYLDDPKYLHIIDEACNQGLYVVTHAGMDIGFPGDTKSSTVHTLQMLDTVHPDKMILAHMGGWDEWDMVSSEILGRDVYLDTAFSVKLPSLSDDRLLSKEQFTQMIKKHGAEHILFGTDSPWSSQKESITLMNELGLSREELDMIFYQNAKIILGI